MVILLLIISHFLKNILFFSWNEKETLIRVWFNFVVDATINFRSLYQTCCLDSLVIYLHCVLFDYQFIELMRWIECMYIDELDGIIFDIWLVVTCQIHQFKIDNSIEVAWWDAVEQCLFTFNMTSNPFLHSSFVIGSCCYVSLRIRSITNETAIFHKI